MHRLFTLVFNISFFAPRILPSWCENLTEQVSHRAKTVEQWLKKSQLASDVSYGCNIFVTKPNVY